MVLGAVCSAVAFVMFFELVAEVGAARTPVITFLNPAVAVGLGVVVLAEPITWGIAVGFPLVLLGSWLATRSNSTPEEAEQRGVQIEDGPLQYLSGRREQAVAADGVVEA